MRSSNRGADAALWHFSEVTVLMRHVRSWGKIGSGQRRSEATRLSRCGPSAQLEGQQDLIPAQPGVSWGERGYFWLPHLAQIGNYDIHISDATRDDLEHYHLLAGGGR